MEYKYKIEMHTHTFPVSGCSEISPANLIKNYKKTGYDGVVLTNHFDKRLLIKDKSEIKDFYLRDYYNAKEESIKQGISLFLGMEIMFNKDNNHYLIYGIDENFILTAYDYLDKGIETFSKDFYNTDIAIFTAHPFRDGMNRNFINLVHGIESYNMHPSHNSKIALAHKYAVENNLIEIAGTDYHDYGSDSLTSLNFLNMPENEIALAKMLKENNFIIGLQDKLLM